jgi:predicted HD superfamily hydrolase involved in NAD metabolism
MVPEFDTPRADEFLALLRERLPDKTFHHVVSVAEFLLTFYTEASITREQAVNAGLLHDVCKALPKDALVEQARAFDITENLDVPNLLHGPVGAEECRRNLGIVDEDVLDAIRFHTTGRKNWNRVGCALYLADFAEPLRTHPQASEARRILSEKGFNAALRYAVEEKVRDVEARFTLDSHSAEFAQWVAAEFPA